VLQASEGGSVSLGRSQHRAKTGQTPTPGPHLNPAGVPKMVARTSVLTDRIVRGATPPGIRSSAIAKAGEVVLSKNTLLGLCLTAFAFGIVTTLAIERGGHSRALEHEAASARPIDPPTDPTITRPAEPAPVAPAAAVAPPPSDPVVVKLAPAAETKPVPPPAALPRKVQAAAAHVAPAAAPPVRPAPVRAKRPTKPAATPADDFGAAPAAPAKKWVDPFEQ